MASRIAPLTPPYPPGAAETLARMTPPGTEPIALFRTLVRNPTMAEAMAPWGLYELGRTLSLSRREREVVIERTTARCGCEYEWSVHVAYFADRVGFTPAQLTSLVHGSAADSCWSDERERLLIEAVDALHDTNDLPDDLWTRLAVSFTDPELLDLLALVGWYHAISYLARATRLPSEPGAPTFASVAPR